MSLSHGTGSREGPRRRRSKPMTLAGLIIFLLIGAVACWGYPEGGRPWPRRQYRGRRYRLADRRLVVWPIGHHCWWTDRVNHSRRRRCDHPPRDCRADQASVAQELLVRGRAGINPFLPRGVLHARTDEEQPTKPAACCFSTSQAGRPGPSSSRRPLHSDARSCARRRHNSSASGDGR